MIDKKATAYAHCFKKGYTAEQVQAAWDKLLPINRIIRNFSEHGHTWEDLPPHLIDDLIKKGGENQ